MVNFIVLNKVWWFLKSIVLMATIISVYKTENRIVSRQHIKIINFKNSRKLCKEFEEQVRLLSKRNPLFWGKLNENNKKFEGFPCLGKQNCSLTDWDKDRLDVLICCFTSDKPLATKVAKIMSSASECRSIEICDASSKVEIVNFTGVEEKQNKTLESVR